MTIPAQVVLPTDAELANSPGPFEGPEKLLEIWFAPGQEAIPTTSTTQLADGLKRRERVKGGSSTSGELRGLRCVPREIWEEMLDIVKCKVLSVVEGDEIDAYLLSESSLFVAPHCIILKTCGTTLNLLGLYRIIEIARQYCGFTNVWRCFYSRKSFFFPERQSGPHKDWRDEVSFLDSVFGSAGTAYIVGPMNRDHWLLYLTSPNSQPLLPSDSALDSTFRLSLPAASPSLSGASSSPAIQSISFATPSKYQDVTLEILMSHLSPEAREPFFSASSSSAGPSRTGHEIGSELSATLGIDKLFSKDETTLDSFGFDPCGYSANAVIGSGIPDSTGGGGYYTIHVTPEEGWSYASFECNVPLPLTAPTSDAANGAVSRPDLTTLIRNVVGIFQPNRLSITLFVSTPQEEAGASTGTDISVIEARAWQAFGGDLLGTGFERKDRIGYEFDGYDLVFACFEKKGWQEPNKQVTVKP